MADTSSKDGARKRALDHFAASEQRSSLAEEEADREAAPNAPPPPKAMKPRRVVDR